MEKEDKLSNADVDVLDKSSDDAVKIICRNLSPEALEDLISRKPRYGKLCGRTWVQGEKSPRSGGRSPGSRLRRKESSIELPSRMREREEGNVDDALRMAILAKIEDLRQGESLDVSDAFVKNGKLEGAEIVKLPQRIPGYPNIVADETSFARIKEILSTKRVRRPSSPQRGREASTPATKPLSLRRRSLEKEHANGITDPIPSQTLKQEILVHERSLPPGKSLDLSEVELRDGEFIGWNVIATPNPRSGGLVNIPGHSKLWVRSGRFGEFSNLLGVRAPKITGKGGCGCGK